MRLRLRALGAFQLELDGMDISDQLDSTRIFLLTYLMDTGRPQTRAHLAELLWPNRPPGRARSNLRTLLTRLRPLLADTLQSDHTWLALQPNEDIWCDLHQFTTFLKAADPLPPHDPARVEVLTNAVALYHDDFLANTLEPEGEALENWLMTRRLQLHGQAVQAIRELLQGSHGSTTTQIALARHLLQLEPLDEATCRTLMQLLAEQDQRDEALWHFQHYQRELAEIWSAATPSEELVMLAAKIRLGMDVRPTVNEPTGKITIAQPTDPLTDNAPHDLRANPFPEKVSNQASATQRPTSRTESITGMTQEPAITKPSALQPFPTSIKPLIGRRQEWKRLVQWLTLGYRLISVTGLGGVGKSHFTQTVLAAETERWRDGGIVVTISESVTNRVMNTEKQQTTDAQAEQRRAVLILCRSIAGALDLPLQNGQEYTEQLAQMLARYDCCLVLDNFELLLPAVPYLQTLLAKASKLTIVVISRRRLQLAAEANIALDGLPSSIDQPGAIIGSGTGTAEELLYLNLVRHRPDLHLSEEDHAVLQTICQAVRGLPLALEMVPALTRRVSLEGIATLLHTDPLTLTADFADTAEQHRSLYMLMDTMFSATTAPIQKALVRLTVFSTLFTAETALCVVNSKEWIALREERWLETADDTLFSLHPLVAAFLRSLSTEQTWADVQAEARRAHATYYAGLVADQPFFQNNHYTKTILWLHQNFAELTTACQTLLVESPADAVPLLHVLTMYGQHFGDLATVQLWLERGLSALPITVPIRFRLLLDYVTCTTDQRDLTAAQAALTEARSQMGTHDDQVALIALYIRLGWAAHLDYSATTPARRQEGWYYFTQALELAETVDNQQQIASILSERAFLTSWDPTSYEQAQADLHRALAIGHQLGQPNLLATVYKFYAYVEFTAGHFLLAERFNERAMQLLGAETGPALIRGWLCTERSQIALAQRDVAEARRYLRLAEQIFGPAGYEAGLTQCNTLQGVVALQEGDLSTAEQYWLRAYRAICRMSHQDKLVISIMLGIGVTQLIQGDPLLGAQLVALARGQYEGKAFHWVPPEQQLMAYLLERATAEIEALALPSVPVDGQMATQALWLLADSQSDRS